MSPSLRDGTISNPFVDLFDAINYGKALVSVSSSTSYINIYLFSGTHYVIQSKGSVEEYDFPKKYFDPLNLNYEITIQPCTTS